jgi:hypothetical protein
MSFHDYGSCSPLPSTGDLSNAVKPTRENSVKRSTRSWILPRVTFGLVCICCYWAVLHLLPASDINCSSRLTNDGNLSGPVTDKRLYHNMLSHLGSDEQLWCSPQHIHLSPHRFREGHDTLVMTISFTLNYTIYPPLTTVSRVVILLDSAAASGPRWMHFAPRPKQFNYTSKETAGVMYQSNWIYHVKVPNLSMGREKYHYRIVVLGNVPNVARPDRVPQSTRSLLRGASAATAWWHRQVIPVAIGHCESIHTGQRTNGSNIIGLSPKYEFHTPPALGEPSTLAIVGDLGQTAHSQRTLDHIIRATKVPIPFFDHDDAIRLPPVASHLVIAGDMSYADTDPYRWPRWMAMMEPLLRSTTVQLAAGNHEIECDSHRQIFVPYEHYFRNPNRLAPAEIVLRPVTLQPRTTMAMPFIAIRMGSFTSLLCPPTARRTWDRYSIPGWSTSWRRWHVM